VTCTKHMLQLNGWLSTSDRAQFTTQQFLCTQLKLLTHCCWCCRSKLASELELAEVKAGAELQLKARLMEAQQAELARREVRPCCTACGRKKQSLHCRCRLGWPSAPNKHACHRVCALIVLACAGVLCCVCPNRPSCLTESQSWQQLRRRRGLPQQQCGTGLLLRSQHSRRWSGPLQHSGSSWNRCELKNAVLRLQACCSCAAWLLHHQIGS
jgi:hypothetical protein